MKQYITMQKTKYSMYRSLQAGDHRFIGLWQIVSDEFMPGKLIEWFMDNTKESKTNESVSISKERGIIALYDISEYISDENYMCINDMLYPERCFEMSPSNFIEILYQWEELRVSRPDIILIVIHEDNHVSLETDPIIIKQYQDAGYAFDYKKHEQKLKEYVCYKKNRYNYLDPINIGRYHFDDIVELIQEKHFPNRRQSFYWPLYQYHNTLTDDFFIGPHFYNSDRALQPAEHELASYVNAENSCQINRHNFLEFEQQWLELENNNTIFAVVYRNEQGWICCKPFTTSEEMYAFVMQTVEL